MVIRNSVKWLLAKNRVTQSMKYLVVSLLLGEGKARFEISK